MRAVLYAAKSTEDVHGSMPTQLDDCRALAQRQGWTIVGEFSDEAFSAWHGNRGPGLEQAKARAVNAATEHGRAILVAQDADRFARGAGDAPGAADHLGEVYFAMKRQRVELWTVRSGHLDLLRATIEGERSSGESDRKSQAVRAGLRRRKQRGRPIGAIPLGYRVHTTVAADSSVLTERIRDEAGAAIIERIFELGSAGHCPGDIARILNAAGLRTKRGKTWCARAVRTVVENDKYTGHGGYPRLVSDDAWQAANDSIMRMDPSAVQRRKGGRPQTEAYALKGVAFCARCGSPLFTRRYAAGRAYLCGAVRQARGTCDAVRIPAELAEGHVLTHLRVFVESVEGWLLEQVRARSREQQAREASIDDLRAAVAALDGKRERHMREYDRMLDERPDLAPLALEAVQRIDRERAAAEQAVVEAEAVAAEWSGPPDMDAALDFYAELVDAVQGKMKSAGSVEALNGMLSEVVAGIWLEVEPERERMLASFEMRVPRETMLPWGEPILPELRPLRESLPPVHTEQQTFINEQVCQSVAIPPMAVPLSSQEPIRV